MKKILFTVIPEKGHLNPCIGPAQHLQTMGNEISFYAAHDLSSQLQAAGLGNFLGPKTIPEETNQGAEFTGKVKDSAWLREWIKSLLIDPVEGQIAAMRTLVSDFDVVVTDPMIYAAAIAAEKENLPWVALSNSLNPVLPDTVESDLLETVSWLSPARAKLFDGLDVEFRGCDALSRHLTIAFTTETFTGGPVAGVHQVGPSQPLGARGDEQDFPWEKLRADQPIIYLSFGSQIYHQPAYFQTMMDAVREKPLQLIAAVHDLEFEDVPSNAILCGYAPQLDILKQAKVMITHGGANSVMEALSTDTPLLIQPICNDQFHQAWFLEKSGCGRRVDLDVMTPGEIWDSIEWAMQADISRVSRSYQVDGARRAAELIAQL